MAIIKINGVDMPDPDVKGGIEESFEAIWSSDTGRTTKGDMKGTLVTTKTTVALNWGSLKPTEFAKLANAIYGKGFTTLSYPSVRGGNRTLTGYFGTPKFSQLNLDGNLYFATGISVTFIEK